jgi:hypothetical protein
MWLIAGELRLPRIIILTHAPDLHYHQLKAFSAHFQEAGTSTWLHLPLQGRGSRG